MSRLLSTYGDPPVAAVRASLLARARETAWAAEPRDRRIFEFLAVLGLKRGVHTEPPELILAEAIRKVRSLRGQNAALGTVGPSASRQYGAG